MVCIANAVDERINVEAFCSSLRSFQSSPWKKEQSETSLSISAGYKITPKPCRIPGPETKEGTCMFVWECIKSEGTHVGVCVDTFMFGSCCMHNSTTNSITGPHNHGSSSDALRPTLAEALGNESTRPTLTSLSSFLVTDSSTARPSHHPSETFETSGGSSRPHKPLPAGSARPLQKRPHAKPTSDHKDRIQTSAVPGSSNFWEKGSQNTKRPTVSDPWDKGSQNPKRPGSPEIWEKGSQSTRRPGSSADLWEKGSPNTKRPGSHSTKRPVYHETQNLQKTRPNDSNQHTGIKEKDTTHAGFQGHYQGFKDKIDTGHNAVVIRLPGKEHASGEDKEIRPNRPNNQRPFESRPDDGKTEDADLAVQESVHRPNVNSFVESVSILLYNKLTGLSRGLPIVV